MTGACNPAHVLTHRPPYAEWAQLEVVLWDDAPRDGGDGRLGTASVPLQDALWRRQGPETLDLKMKSADGVEVCLRLQAAEPMPC